MARLKTRFDDLPLDLTLQAAFTPIVPNVTDGVTTRKEYVKTHAKLLKIVILCQWRRQITQLPQPGHEDVETIGGTK